MKNSKLKLFITGYIYDFEFQCCSKKNVDILRIWPTNEEIYDAIRIGYKQATDLNRFLGIRLLENEIPTIFPVLHNNELNTSEINENGNNLNNQLVDESYSWTDAQLVADEENIIFEVIFQKQKSVLF